MKKEQIIVQGVGITILEGTFVSLTDIAKKFNEQDPFILINNWMRLRDTIELLGTWEFLHNPGFKPIEFDRFKTEST